MDPLHYDQHDRNITIKVQISRKLPMPRCFLSLGGFILAVISPALRLVCHPAKTFSAEIGKLYITTVCALKTQFNVLV